MNSILATIFLLSTHAAAEPAPSEPQIVALEQPPKKLLFQRADDVSTTIGPRLLTDELQPMFGVRLDHAISDRWTANITAGAIGDFDGVVGGSVTLGVDLHPFGGGLSGMYMGPRLTGNFRDTEQMINGKLPWGYNLAIQPGVLIGAGVGPGVQTKQGDTT